MKTLWSEIRNKLLNLEENAIMGYLLLFFLLLLSKIKTIQLNTQTLNKPHMKQYLIAIRIMA